MPIGNEIHFGFVGVEDTLKAAHALGMITSEKLVEYQSNQKKFLDVVNFGGEKEIQLVPDRYDTLLMDVYENTLTRLGWTFSKPIQNGRYYLVESPYGERTAVPFGMNFLYDPDEAGDYPEDVSLGVSLSSRYFPTLLDMESTHGGLSNSIIMNTESPIIETAKVEILYAFPQFRVLKPQVFLRTIFY